MSGDESLRVVAAYLEDANADLDLVEAAIERKNRLGAYHLQQAAEKLVKAVRLVGGLLATKEHRLEILIDGSADGRPPGLPSDDPWRDRLLSLSPLSGYATTFRYPTPSGRLKPPPAEDDLRDWAARVRQMLDDARREFLEG